MASGSPPATLSDVFAQAQRLRLELSSGIEQLERSESMPQLDPMASAGYGMAHGSDSNLAAVSGEMAQHLRGKLHDLQRCCAEMENLWRGHHNRGQRDIWKRKVEHMVEEADSLRLALDRFLAIDQRRRHEAEQRAELLRMRAGGQGRRALTEEEAEARDMETVRRAGQVVESSIAQGIATLAHMAQQRDVLKGAQRRALDVLNTVGLSDTVLKKINRRQVVDKAITYGGMIFTLVLVYLVWRWVH